MELEPASAKEAVGKGARLEGALAQMGTDGLSSELNFVFKQLITALHLKNNNLRHLTTSAYYFGAEAKACCTLPLRSLATSASSRVLFVVMRRVSQLLPPISGRLWRLRVNRSRAEAKLSFSIVISSFNLPFSSGVVTYINLCQRDIEPAMLASTQKCFF